MPRLSKAEKERCHREILEMEQVKIKPYLDRIEDLEKKNKVLTQNLEDTEIINKAFEKENAELKEHLKCLIVGMYHIAQHHPTMGAHTKIMQDLREAEQFLKEVEKCGQ